MSESQVRLVGGDEIRRALEGRELEVVDVVERAYLSHGAGSSSLPHSTFLSFPDDRSNRIIALPAFLGDGFGLAGVKWIASFPGNVARGMARASAVLVLNSCDTGRPFAVLEGSVVSAQRTAASAALAARVLYGERRPERVGVVGTGLIAATVLRFLAAVLPDAERFLLLDLDRDRAAGFGRRLGRRQPSAEVELAASVDEVLASSDLIVFTTTAVTPWVEDLSGCRPGALILHLSLRDLAPSPLLRCDNVVDDVDHVLRAGTSLHLAEQQTGRRDFIRCTLPQILLGQAPAQQGDSVTVFSPFGLGILDLAVGDLAVRRVTELGGGRCFDDFLPTDPES